MRTQDHCEKVFKLFSQNSTLNSGVLTFQNYWSLGMEKEIRNMLHPYRNTNINITAELENLKMEYVSVDQNSDQNSDQKSDKNSDQNSGQNSDQDSDQDSHQDSDQILSKHLIKILIKF